MPDPQCPSGLLLSCLPWRGEVEAQGCSFAGERQAGRTAPEEIAAKGEAMTYKRGGVYWYKFRWTLKYKTGQRELSRSEISPNQQHETGA